MTVPTPEYRDLLTTHIVDIHGITAQLQLREVGVRPMTAYNPKALQGSESNMGNVKTVLNKKSVSEAQYLVNSMDIRHTLQT